MIDNELRERIKLLIDYEGYKAQTDAVTGCSDFDFPISSVKIDKYVITINMSGGKYFFLPIRNYKVIEEEERLKEEAIEREKEKALLLQRKKEEDFLKKFGARLESVARRASTRSASDEDGKIDGAAWWCFLETYYPDNYRTAEVFYHKEDNINSPILQKFLGIAPNATINDFFSAMGLPTIKAVDGKIKINEEVVATYDGCRINKGGESIQYRSNFNGPSTGRF